MYRRKNRKYNYNKNQSNDTIVLDDDVYQLFNSIRYSSKTSEQFSNDLDSLIQSKKLMVNEIIYQGNNLLVHSAIFENEVTFKVLIEKFKDELLESLPKCIFYLYPNKNPQILQLALNSQGIPSEEFKSKLSQNVSEHCYRSENIKILKTWFEKYFNETELLSITSQLIKNNNKPFLREVCYDSFWKKLVSKTIPDLQELITNQKENYFYHIITSSEHQHYQKEDTNYNYNISLITGTNCQSSTKNADSKNEKNTKVVLTEKTTREKESVQPVIIKKRKLSIS